MNIEKQNVSLMPVMTHQATPTPKAAEPSARPTAKPMTAPAQQGVEQIARAQQATVRRIEIAEKMMGANKSLVIEKDAHRVGFVYKTIDRSTGEVVRVWPQREVASALEALADSDAHAVTSGMMIDAKA